MDRDRRGMGGDHETYRASWHSAEIDFAHRTGFVRLVLKRGVRIVTVLDLPGRLPLPAKISIEVLPPIDLREELGGARGDPDQGHELVTGRIQDALHELDQARALPLIG